MKNVDEPKTPLFKIDTIAAHLEGLEETIIYKLIDRAQFHANERVYQAGHSGFDGEQKRSLFELRLLYQERMDAEFGRFCVPEERPFYRRLPEAKRSAKLPPTGLFLDDFNAINQMPEITARYLDLVQTICRRGDDGHYGSSVEHDVYALQAIARRIHYGSLYVGEGKFRSAPDVFTALIEKGDEQAIIEKLTRRDVEERIVRRISEKVALAQSKVNTSVRHAVDPLVITDFYREVIVPLTKKGEARYLLQRRG
jgi:chorismate mutase